MHAPALWITSYGAFNADGSLFDTPKSFFRRKEDDAKKVPLYPGPDGFSMIEMPYKGQGLVMIVIAPNKADGLPALEKKLTAEKLNMWISQMKHRDSHVYLPKFRFEAEYDLADTLKSMGMKDAFGATADFSGISPSDQLFLSQVTHKTFVEVNEKGTEAAAVTVVATQDKADIAVEFVPTFKADRPFLYLIQELHTESILFMGRMTTPTE